MTLRNERRRLIIQKKKKNKFITPEKKFDKKAYVVLVSLFVCYLIYKLFFKNETIGYDYRYTIYIFTIPTSIGIILLGYYRRNYIKKSLLEPMSIFSKSIFIFLTLFQGFLFSYFSLGLIAEASWNYINEKKSVLNKTETFRCQITGFNFPHRKSYSYSFWFTFQNDSELIFTDYSTLNNYSEKKPENYEVFIQAQKGIWNYYTVTNWSINYK
jgi:hypothetical protein